MATFSRLIVASAAALLLWGCDVHTDMPCEPVGDREPICGLQAPEDIEVTPDRGALILGQFGGIQGEHSGSMALFDPVSEKATELYPEGAAQSERLWGDENCPGEPGAVISPHGIHLSQRDDGRWQLLVVNHGGRESVEFFEWLGDSQQLAWRGCLVMPETAFINDVVATPDGGLLVTQMFTKDSALAMLRSFMGSELGHVWRWRPGAAIDILPGSKGAFPNGIQISPDGRYVFVNMYMDDRIRKIERETGKVVAEAEVVQADNTSWLPDGRLLAASHPPQSVLPEICTNVRSGACPLPFELVAIDPDTMATQTLFEHSGAPMGAGTVAVELGDYWYIGSYAGNRLLKVPAP